MYGHPWMDQGCHVIHGYSDNGAGSVCMAINGWTRDVTVTTYVIHGYTDKGVGSVCMAIRGWTGDVTVTMSSRVGSVTICACIYTIQSD